MGFVEGCPGESRSQTMGVIFFFFNRGLLLLLAKTGSLWKRIALCSLRNISAGVSSMLPIPFVIFLPLWMRWVIMNLRILFRIVRFMRKRRCIWIFSIVTSTTQKSYYYQIIIKCEGNGYLGRSRSLQSIRSIIPVFRACWIITFNCCLSNGCFSVEQCLNELVMYSLWMSCQLAFSFMQSYFLLQCRWWILA